MRPTRRARQQPGDDYAGATDSAFHHPAWALLPSRKQPLHIRALSGGVTAGDKAWSRSLRKALLFCRSWRRPKQPCLAGPLASDRPTRQLRKVGQRHKGNRLRDAVGAHVKIILPLQETIGRSAFDGLDQPD